MNKQTNVLIFPAGEVNSVELHDALATCVNIKLFGASSIDRHGPYIFKNFIGGIPLISDDKFIESFNKTLNKYEIDIIFPTHDTVAAFFADNQAEIAAKVIVADQVTSAICRDKRKTYDLFTGASYIPHIYDNNEQVSPPVFIKPRIGAGSVGAKLVELKEELQGLNFSDYVVSEYLPGEEYTVDCLTDKEGVLTVVSPRSRDRTLAGISVGGEIKPLTPEVQNIAEGINNKLSFRGLWFFQIKKDKQGVFKLLEISTRCAGGMGLTRAAGINLPLLSVYVALGYNIDAPPNPYKVKVDRTLISRYKIDYSYDTVYLDFDDTVVINGAVNLYAIMFIYQCNNQGIALNLITKHADNVGETLGRHKLSKDVFSKIIHLTDDEHKIDHIDPKNAIFIDNAYQERKLVKDKYNIPVFDVDGIEVLLDWRT